MRRLFGRGARSGGSGLSTAALSPMVDLLTILLVAVLRTWSADPPMQAPEAGFKLPLSREEVAVGRGVAVDIGLNGLYVEGNRAGSVAYWIKSDEVLVTDVYELLQVMAGSKVVIRAHEDAPWELVGKLLFTAQQAGYADVELVAVSQASL